MDGDGPVNEQKTLQRLVESLAEPVVSLGTTPARPVLEEVTRSLGDRARAADIDLVVRAGGDVELPLRPRMLRVVVANLIENAIRYAGAGSTCVVEASAEGAAPKLIV